MLYAEWSPQLAINPPVYLDANVLVGALVRAHRLYPACVRLAASLLTRKSSVLISPVSLDECLWATAKLAYCELTKNPSTAHWTKQIYLRWRERIFQSYEGWITAVGSMMRDWSDAGVPVEVVPKSEALWQHVVELTPDYMRQFRLSPADAMHLALAQTHARTFVTADSDFDELRKNPPAGELVVVHLAS